MTVRLHWPTLTWRKANYPSSTYHAQTATHTYTVDHDGTAWRLRVWHEGQPVRSPQDYATSAAELQQAADEHAAQNGGAQ